MTTPKFTHTYFSADSEELTRTPGYWDKARSIKTGEPLTAEQIKDVENASAEGTVKVVPPES